MLRVRDTQFHYKLIGSNFQTMISLLEGGEIEKQSFYLVSETFTIFSDELLCIFNSRSVHYTMQQITIDLVSFFLNSVSLTVVSQDT